MARVRRAKRGVGHVGFELCREDAAREVRALVAILAHLELPTEAPPIERARSPGFKFA